MPLCVTRRIGQKLFISIGDQEACVSVVEIGTNRIRLQIDAPSEILIEREEFRAQRRQQPKKTGE
jgi:carbon storage regulator CsrA